MMRCEKCGEDSVVKDSRHHLSKHNRASACEPGFIYRRRQCLKCGHKWSTVEMHVNRMDDYDLETERDRLKQRLKALRHHILELERITR
ncbi:MAG: hypothetical protein CGW95_00970 [Phenylobacterium zucineum]|nr:MAG: hypothetical protein CGW95_00970 [Phenylobacterium zucineum]